MDVKAIQARLAAHAVERNWDPFFSPRSLSMAVAGESGALLEKFQWLSEDQARRIGKTQDRAALAESLADIVLYATRLADIVEVDLEEAVLARAASKYPVSARRFEGVDDAEARATRQPAPTRPAPEARRADAEMERTPSRSATPVSEPPARAVPHATPVRTPQVRVTDDGPREAARSNPAPTRSEPPPRARQEPPARERAPAARARSEPPARERVEPPAAREQPAAREPEPAAPRGERYASLDTNAVLDLMKALTKRIDDVRSDDTILHELKDEMATIRRNIYSSKSKPAWIAGGLERLRALLEEAASHPIGDKVNFRDTIAQITGMLEQ